MHLVQRKVHHFGEVTLDPHIAPDQAAHQVADGRVFTQRYQRTEVAVAPFLQWSALETIAHLLQHVRGLLVCRLRTRRHQLAFAAAHPWTRRAIADRKNVFVTRRAQRRMHYQLVDAIGFQPADILEKFRALTPAAQTTSSAGMISPEASLTPSGRTSATFAELRTCTLRSSRNLVADLANRSGTSAKIGTPPPYSGIGLPLLGRSGR